MLQITPSALKHGVDRQDIEHAWRNAIRLLEQEYGGDLQVLVIGPDRSGALLELVAMPTQAPERIIHADRLRPRRYDLL